jgi:hypothetical protein
MSLAWPWHFTFVSPAEQQHRRELLDLRGYYAQLSVLIALAAFKCYRSSFSHAEYASDSRRAHRSWWESAPFRGWSETPAQYVACLVWLGWLLGLSMWRSGEGMYFLLVCCLAVPLCTINNIPQRLTELILGHCTACNKIYEN